MRVCRGGGSPSGRPLTFDCPCAEFFNSDSYSVNSCYDKWLVFRIFSFHKLFSTIRSGFFYFKAYSVSEKTKKPEFCVEIGLVTGMVLAVGVRRATFGLGCRVLEACV